MKYKEMLLEIEKIEFDKKHLIYSGECEEIYLIRPSKLPKRLKNKYDLSKNFQIWLKEGEREFRPNHLRVLIDLNLRARSRPDLKEELLVLFDNVFYGKDPEMEVELVEKEAFAHYLNSLKVIAILAQLFLLEQEINYTRESNFEPKNLFLQGWIREFIDSPKEIDNMCMSVCNGQPPKAQYTDKENKKNKKYTKNLKKSWYLLK
ncbi:hypothetical protein JXB28_02175 [Candidatus Woesearchaeota archaeon]|nr:hypothetical protein [Candidatus Woesearchaeota archaeon]